MEWSFFLQCFEYYMKNFQFFHLSIGFGLCGYLIKVSTAKVTKGFYNLFAEIVYSMCAGYVCYKLCLFFKFPEELRTPFVCIACLSGSPFLMYMERVQRAFFNKKLNIDFEDEAVKEKVEQKLLPKPDVIDVDAQKGM